MDDISYPYIDVISKLKMLIGIIEILRKWIIDESKRKTLKSKN